MKLTDAFGARNFRQPWVLVVITDGTLPEPSAFTTLIINYEFAFVVLVVLAGVEISCFSAKAWRGDLSFPHQFFSFAASPLF